MECEIGNLTRTEAIKARLRSQGTSLSQIGRDLGLKPSTISTVVAGARSLKVEQALAEALDMTVGQLFPERYGSEGGSENGLDK